MNKKHKQINMTENKWKIAAYVAGAVNLYLGYKLIQKEVQNSNLLEITKSLNRELEELAVLARK